MRYVPVVDRNQQPLMPTTANRAASWIKSGKATPFWKRGIFCVRLNQEPSARETQPIALGIDPGSKREASTVKSAAHTYLNLQNHAVTWVSDAVETRRNLRHSRRYRKTPCRKPRWNRASLSKKGRIPPSTRARWGLKIRIATWLSKMYPISQIVLEDIKAATKKGARNWNANFSPLQTGKNWAKEQLELIAPVLLVPGHETAEIRNNAGLKKSKDKLSSDFSAHAVDSWVLANHWVGGHTYPDNTQVLELIPLRFHRRQLHVQRPAKGGVRRRNGSTRSMGFKRGSLVRHPKWGLTYIGGTRKERVSLHSLQTGKRLCRKAKVEDIKFLTYNSWRLLPPPRPAVGVSAAK